MAHYRDVSRARRGSAAMVQKQGAPAMSRGPRSETTFAPLRRRAIFPPKSAAPANPWPTRFQASLRLSAARSHPRGIEPPSPRPTPSGSRRAVHSPSFTLFHCQAGAGPAPSPRARFQKPPAPFFAAGAFSGDPKRIAPAAFNIGCFVKFANLAEFMAQEQVVKQSGT